MGRKRQADPTKRAAITQAGHVELFPRKPSTAFAEALDKLALTKRTAAELFNGLVTLSQLRDWRRGRSKPPAWVVDRLRETVNARCAALQDPINRIAISPGMGWNKHATRGIGEWRAKRNLEKP